MGQDKIPGKGQDFSWEVKIYWQDKLDHDKMLHYAVVGKLPVYSSGVILLYFHYWYKKLATFNPLPIFHCNGSVIVT